MKLVADDDVAYIYYLGRHNEYGDTICVLGVVSLPDSEDELEVLISKGYITFYPVKAAINQGLITIATHYDMNLQMPQELRRAGVRENDGTIRTWIIEQNGREYVTKTLSINERAMPIAAIWNHEMLCIRIRERWHPEQED